MQLGTFTTARFISILTLAIFLSTTALAASHASNSAGKRLLPKQHKPGSNAPRRPHPFPEELEKQRRSGDSLLSRLFSSAPRKAKSKRHAKKHANLGPGPGFAASLEAWKRSQAKRKEEENAQLSSHHLKRQANASASATATSSGAAASSTSAAPVWLLDDVYEGDKFFPYFSFYSYSDPTHGLVNYVDQATATSDGLAYVRQSDKKIIMKADNTTYLGSGQSRASVRVQSQKTYTGGLFLLDLDRGPYGCGVWPAFWTTNPNWPYNGEIDIYEGVHLSTNNQMTWHTDPGCNLKSPGGFTGNANSTDCNAFINNNEGCAVTDNSYSSSGATLRNIGGGVFAMKWDTTGISIWFFPRAVIPDDILAFTPDPTLWGTPQAHLSPDECNIIEHFQEHSIIFNITFCGDWAGMTYLTSGCPGTCNDQIMNPANFDDAIWEINSVRVYTTYDLQAGVLNAAEPRLSGKGLFGKLVFGLAFVLCLIGGT